MPVRLVGINHVALEVGDIDEALAFWESIFGELEMRGHNRGMAFIDTGSCWDAGQTDPHTRVLNDDRKRTSVGVGLAIKTPFSPAPVRLYISRAIEHTPYDRLKIIDFTLGTRF